MTKEEKARVQWGIDYAEKHIKKIEASSKPLWEKYQEIGSQLTMMLDDVVEALPKAMRKQVKDCLAMRKAILDTDLAESHARLQTRFAESQQKASPSCLPTEDSLIEVVQ